MRKCITHSVDERTFLAQKIERRRALRSIGGDAAGGIKYIGGRYWDVSLDGMSVERIAAQHSTINACFNAKNSDLSKLPPDGSTHYDFRDVVGNPGIVILPMDTAALSAVTTRIALGRRYGGNNPLADAIAAIKADGHVLEDGTLHIIIADLDDGILGQGAVMGQSCIIHSGAFGGFDTTAPLPDYALGKTAVHELAHVFSLIHTFHDAGTTCVQPHPDVPTQRLPNYSASLQDGGKLDNRYRDCRIASGDNSVELNGETQPYSCIDLANCSSGQYEFFFQYMDYVPDADMICFSIDQAKTMDTYLRTQNVLKLLTSDGGMLTLPSSEASSDAGPVGPASAGKIVSMVGICLIILSALLMLVAMVMMRAQMRS